MDSLSEIRLQDDGRLIRASSLLLLRISATTVHAEEGFSRGFSPGRHRGRRREDCNPAGDKSLAKHVGLALE